MLPPDRQTVWLPQVGQSGYRRGDFNLDGSALANDLNHLLLPTVGRQSQVPGGGALAPPDGAPAWRSDPSRE